jgi:hypothetical protein
MKLFKVSVFCALIIAVCLPAVGHAQMQLKIPFSIFASGTYLPPGTTGWRRCVT